MGDLENNHLGFSSMTSAVLTAANYVFFSCYEEAERGRSPSFLPVSLAEFSLRPVAKLKIALSGNVPYFVITMKFLRKKNIEHFNRSSRVVDLFLLYGSGSSISKNFRIRILRFRVSHFQKNLKSSFIFSISSF